MSLVLFFGLTTVVVLVGFTLVALTIRHHWKQSKLKPANGKKA